MCWCQSSSSLVVHCSTYHELQPGGEVVGKVRSRRVLPQCRHQPRFRRVSGRKMRESEDLLVGDSPKTPVRRSSAKMRQYTTTMLQKHPKVGNQAANEILAQILVSCGTLRERTPLPTFRCRHARMDRFPHTSTQRSVQLPSAQKEATKVFRGFTVRGQVASPTCRVVQNGLQTMAPNSTVGDSFFARRIVPEDKNKSHQLCRVALKRERDDDNPCTSCRARVAVCDAPDT